MKNTNNQAVAKLIVRKTRMKVGEELNEQTFVTRTKRDTMKCFNCGEMGHAPRNCGRKNICKTRQGDGKTMRSYKCGQARHIYTDCRLKNSGPASDTAVVTLPSALVTVPNSRKSINGCLGWRARATSYIIKDI